MRPIKFLPILCLTVSSATNALDLDRERTQNRLSALNDRTSENEIQLPINPGPVQPPSSAPQSDHPMDNNRDHLTISDMLPRTRGINVFASFTRDIASVSSRLQSIGNGTTLLAPLNSAMQELPRKPWEDSPNDNSGVSAADNEDKAAQNLKRFVEQHIVPVYPWNQGQENKIRTLGGQELWWEERAGKKVILPGELVVKEVVGQVGNGEVWTLKGVVHSTEN